MSDHYRKTFHQAERAARMATWLRMTAERRSYPDFADPVSTERMLDDDDWWHLLARMTPGVKDDRPPSKETRTMCVGFLKAQTEPKEMAK